MNRIELLLRSSCIDVRHIEKHADEEFEERLREYTKQVIMDVVQVIKDAEFPLEEEGARDEILFDIETKYELEIE